MMVVLVAMVFFLSSTTLSHSLEIDDIHEVQKNIEPFMKKIKALGAETTHLPIQGLRELSTTSTSDCAEELSALLSSSCTECSISSFFSSSNPTSTSSSTSDELTSWELLETMCSFESGWDFFVVMMGISASDAESCEECGALVDYFDCAFDLEDLGLSCPPEW
eukprot:CAMPEP_0117752280 /NCGR_PEP_ID=MMETSP0947-20121206/11514_1 /TAXON_ID=44440 /ORGANISM="Chattonella subsalsa, Strain CCMP2191" /LENGTH=163 /DNA_ID=CAMNT_0005570897 /DNA_START=172 /DNA_END=660 /DNA_ORIENTATION=+